MTRDLQGWLTDRVARAVGRPAQSIDRDLPFHEFGLESVDLVEISGELEELLGRRIDPDVLYEHPTVATLASHLREALPRETALPDPKKIQGQIIAIVGIGCRFPGASGHSAYWRLLMEGIDAISEIPPDRWDSRRYYQAGPRAPGKTTTRWGGFLEDVDGFDHAFFGISDAEASAMDPQQRALLEVCWEAIEDAGQPVSALRGREVGVFIGISHNDYEAFHLHDLARANHFSGAGNALSIAANRLSYQFDFRGPSLAVDTACSSSLTAVHLAVRSLRVGESRVAVAGGVNVLLSPDPTVAFSQAGMMAPDGRCKAFDTAANGYVRSEGVGLVVLKRLEDAMADDDRIYAVIRGSALNQDGKSNGLNAPNPAAQEAVLRAAYADAGIEPESVDYVETHGTGTRLGDPIEASALARVVGSGSGRSTKCLIGSVKSNIGHLESAAGIAGLIKASLICCHGQVPRSLHFETPNPHIPFETNGLEVPREAVSLPRQRRVGVSAFGFGGTNCHVVLEAGPLAATTKPAETEPALVLLSAATPQALDVLKRRWVKRLAEAEPGDSMGALARSGALGRDPLRCRWAATAVDKTELAHKLTQSVPQPLQASGKLAFVFPGQGTQHRNMAMDLARRFPAFCQTLDRADEILRPLIGCSILDAIKAGDPLDKTAIAQPAIAAVQIAVTDLLTDFGVRAEMVVGHSVGEVAAAYAAGALGFAEALRIVALRGRLMDQKAAEGAMLAVSLSQSDLRAALDAVGADLDIAAINSAESTVAAGSYEDLRCLAASLKADGVASRFINESYAFHSRRIEHAAQAVGSDLGPVQFCPPERRFYSSVKGGAYDGALDAAYWADNVRRPVNFAETIDTMLADGCGLFIEIGPDAILTPLLKRWPGAPGTVIALPAMRRRAEACLPLLTCLGELFQAGLDLELRGLFPGRGSGVRSPGNPWVHTDELVNTRLAAREDSLKARGGARHPVLGRAVQLPRGMPLWLWETSIGVDLTPWLLDHRVAGSPVYPAAAVIGLFQAAATQAMETDRVRLSAMHIRKPLLIDEPATVSGLMKVELDDQGSSAKASLLIRRPGGTFEVYAEAMIERNPDRKAAIDGNLLSGARARCVETVAPDYFYDRLLSAGLQYGPAFQTIASVWRRDHEALGEMHADLPESDGYLLHPGVLDGAVQLVAAALPAFWTAASPWLPVGIDRVVLESDGRPTAVHVTLREIDEALGRVMADIVLVGGRGEVVGRLEGLAVQRLSRQDSAVMRQARLLAKHHLYVDEWRDRGSSAGEPVTPLRILLLMDVAGAGRALAATLRTTGHEVIEVGQAQGSQPPPTGSEQLINPAETGEIQQCVQAATANGQRLDAVICLWPMDLRPGAPSAVDTALLGLAGLIRSLAYSGGARPPRLWIVTRGGVDATSGGFPVPAQAAVWGLGLAAAFEAPALRTTRIDLDPGAPDPAPSLNVLAGLISEEPADGDQFSERSGRIRARRLAVLDVGLTRAGLRDDAAYIVTGGAGAIGLSLAGGLVENGARHIVLMGRRALDGPLAEKVASLGGGNADVLYTRVDVSDERALCAELDAIRAERPIAGVFHAAGSLKDGALFDLNPADLAQVFQGKAQGAWNLHVLTEGDPLDLFVLFSSAAASVGSFGQSAYMAANGFLGGLADYRKALGLPVLCAEWGPWADAGMAAEAATRQQAAGAVAGISMIDHIEGVQLLLGLVAGEHARVTILPYDLSDLLHLYPDSLGLSLFEGLVDESFQRRRSNAGQLRIASRPALMEPYIEPSTEIESMIAGIWQRALKIEPIGVRDPFFELGGDSVFAGQVLSEINRTLGVAIDAEAAFEDLTIQHLARLVDAALVDAVSNMSEDELEAVLVPLVDGEQP